MARHRINKPNFHDFCKALDAPSNHAQHKDAEGRTSTVSPFSETKSIEHSFVLAVAEREGVQFEKVPPYAKNNVKDFGLDQLKSGLVMQYANLKRGGWYDHQDGFSPEAAVDKLEADVAKLAKNPPARASAHRR